MSKFSVWAYVSAGGCVLADSAWATEQDVWRIVLGWPGPEEIAEARRTGALVALCTLTVEDVRRDHEETGGRVRNVVPYGG